MVIMLAFAYDQFLRHSFSTLDQFVEELGDLLKCPVTVENSHHHLLAYSEHGEGTDQARVSTIIGRKVPAPLIHRFWKDGIMASLNQSSEPISIAEIPDMGLGPRVALSVRDQEGRVLGYIWVSETNRTLTAYEQQWLKKAARKAARLMQKANRYKRGEASNEERLWKLLTNTHELGDIPEEVRQEERQSSILLIDLANQLEHMETVQTLFESSNAVLFMFDGEFFIAFIYGKDLRKQVGAFAEKLPDGVHIAAGNPSFAVDGCARAYEQAKALLELKKRFGSELADCLFYYEAGAYKYIQPYEDTAMIAGDHPAIEQLREYDAENQTSLLETLAMYIEKDGHLTAAAKALHVHPNSLQYRLKRIAELTGLHLRNPAERIGLYLDLQRKKAQLSVNSTNGIGNFRVDAPKKKRP